MKAPRFRARVIVPWQNFAAGGPQGGGAACPPRSLADAVGLTADAAPAKSARGDPGDLMHEVGLDGGITIGLHRLHGACDTESTGEEFDGALAKRGLVRIHRRPSLRPGPGGAAHVGANARSSSNHAR